ncbi:MAG: hypothetical protein EXS09_08045 [Gemmataceae bacterium]|nr:hypothetical protein [Gemmataceae bacterium]
MRSPLAISGLLFLTVSATAQIAPEIGYVYPPGGKAGTTVNVQIGGSEWTPDMEFFVHDQRVKLEVLGPPGDLLIPPPPYWYGAKGRLGSLPLLRERLARFVLPAGLPSGPIRWQAANANGATSTGLFIVGNGIELIEDEKRNGSQLLPTLPVTVSGRLLKNEEVDRYRFSVAKAGPVTCELTARRLGSNFNGVLEVVDAQNRVLAECVDTEGNDPILTFLATAGTEYTIAVRDIDHAGDRSYTYRLSLSPGSRMVATIPAVGRRGETREFEFFGIGIATGANKLESVRRVVALPAGVLSTFEYRLETPLGVIPHAFTLSDMAEAVVSTGMQPFPATLPAAVTGVLDEPNTEGRFVLSGKKGDRWLIAAEARRFGSPLDLSLKVLGADGKQLAINDDLPGTTDAGLDFTLPVDGAYQLVVSDSSGSEGSRNAIYRLSVRPQTDGFTLHVPVQKLIVPLGSKTPLNLKATRTGNFKGPIAITIAGLPPGITAPPALVIPADKADLAITLEGRLDSAVTASLVTITGTAPGLTRTAIASTTANLALRSPEENEVTSLLIAMTMKPRVKGEPVDKDTGRKVPRGSTHPADVTLQRLEGYAGEIVLRQAARQSYQVQGITGRDHIVPPGVAKTAFPCFMPEWLETSRTSRMGIMAEVKVPDPKGNVRHLIAPIAGFVTMTMEGALLKLSSIEEEVLARVGEPILVKVRLARSPRLTDAVKLELRVSDEFASSLKAQPMVVAPGQAEAEFKIEWVPGSKPISGEHVLTIRGTTMLSGNLPVISETMVRLVFANASKP